MSPGRSETSRQPGSKFLTLDAGVYLHCMGDRQGCKNKDDAVTWLTVIWFFISFEQTWQMLSYNLWLHKRSHFKLHHGMMVLFVLFLSMPVIVSSRFSHSHHMSGSYYRCELVLFMNACYTPRLHTLHSTLLCDSIYLWFTRSVNLSPKHLLTHSFAH